MGTTLKQLNGSKSGVLLPGGRLTSTDRELERPTVESAQSPQRDSQAGQYPGKDGDPHNCKSALVGVISRISRMSRSRNTEPAKTEEAGSAGHTSADVTA